MIAQGAIRSGKIASPCWAGIISATHGLKSKWRCAPLPFLRMWYNDRAT